MILQAEYAGLSALPDALYAVELEIKESLNKSIQELSEDAD